MLKKIFSTMIVLSFACLSVTMANNINNVSNDSFSSPLAQKSYRQTGSITTQTSIQQVANSVSSKDGSIAYTQRSTGCSCGCSTGCSSGCSMGCSCGCSMGCR